MKRVLTLTTIVFLLSLAPHAMAQQTATVTGTVTDTTGALIPGAEVTATNNNTGISRLGISGETGSYTLQSLQPGPYNIVASLPGFSDATIQINLSANQTYRENFELQVGTVATAVEVISDADALLATTGASVGDALPEEEVLALPLATRDIFDLLDTTAGLVRDRNEDDATNFAGTRVSAVNTTRDGIPVSDGRYLDWNGAFSATYSSPDLVEEIQVSVGTVDAAAGRGSSQVRLQTRSGTNEFHGALFYTTNNSALNANDWFDNFNGRDKNYENRNQFGGRIGGPIVQNKMFFFVLLDEQRYRRRQNIQGAVLTAQARQGIFRYWPGAENDNALGGAGASVDLNGNPVRPAGATGDLQSFNVFSDVNDPHRGSGISNNPFIQESLRRMPTPNDFTAGDGLNTARINWVRRESGDDNAAGTSQDTNRDNLNVRFDYQINDSNKVNFVMSREHNFNDGNLAVWPGGFKGLTTRDPRIYTAQWTSSITPTVLNEFRFGERETSWHGRGADEVGCCFGDDERLDNLTPEAEEALTFVPATANGYPYSINMGVIHNDGFLNRGTRSQRSPLYTFSDNLSWVVGSHSFQAGWEGVWADSDGWNGGGLFPSASVGNGNFPVTGIEGRFEGLDDGDAQLATELLNDLSGSVGGQNQRYLVNDPSRGFDDILVTNKQQLNYHQDDWAAFFKDDWNVSQNLTLNYGVRWDNYGVPYEAKGLNTRPADKDQIIHGTGPTGLAQIITVGPNSLNPDLSLYDRDWNNVAPSFGFSYRVPWLDRTTVVRGGYGISYSGAPTFLQYDFGPGRNPGKAFSAGLTPAVYTALPGSTNPDASTAQFPLPLTIEPYGVIPLTHRRSDVFLYANDRRIPYIQNFNVSIETEIAPDTNLSVSWVGTTGTSLWGERELNEYDIFNNGILPAFITTREGGDSALFADMFEGLNFGSGVIGTDVTASSALRQWSRTDDFFADGEAAGFAEFVNATNAGGGGFGGMLRANGYPEDFIVIAPQFDDVDVYGNQDHSSYHSLQTQVTKRTSSGFSGQLTYTWSKAIGDAAGATFRAREDQSGTVRDPRNRNLQKGVVGFHRTHSFNSHGVWSLPFGPGRLIGSGAPSALSRIIEGWQLSSIFSWSSGGPIAVTAGLLQTIAANDLTNTPDLLGGISAFPKSFGSVNVPADGNVNYFGGTLIREREPTTDYYGSNPDALESHDAIWQIVDSSGNVILRNPKPGTTGNLGGNWLEGPSSLGLDAALSKSIQIREGAEFTIRLDAINVLNTPLFNNPNLDINSRNFGRITSSGGERTFTLNARIDF
jgi:hypothetical protein